MAESWESATGRRVCEFAPLRLSRCAGLCLLVLIMLGALPAAALPQPDGNITSPRRAARVSAVRGGAIPTRDGLRLKLTTNTGDVHIFTDASGEVRYRVRVEASDSAAAALLRQFSLSARATARGVVLTGRIPNGSGTGRVWVSYEVHVPRRYSLQISTQAGDIVTQSIDGEVTLSTGGGNIRAGNIAPANSPNAPEAGRDWVAARLVTGGGHILVGNVAGSLVASTAGGHITAGNVQGDAVLHTGGGHIHVERVIGKADLSTGGGNIVAERADGGVSVETAGGQIELGEAAGAIRAHTGGGGIRIGRLAGPTQLDSSDGRIFLAGVEAPLRASTETGTITAWFSPLFGAPSAVSLSGASALVGNRLAHRSPPEEHSSELASGDGDIIVYLPRKMAVTIDALVEHGSDHRIVADPSLPLKMSYEDSAAGRALHGEGTLNGGGEVLHLKTAGGNIQLRFLDPGTERRLTRQQMELVARRLQAQKALLLEAERQAAEVGEEVQEQPSPAQSAAVRFVGTPSDDAGKATDHVASAAVGPFAELTQMIEQLWGSVRVDPAEQQRRLIHAVMPRYPDAARQAGIEGDVTLRLLIGKDGTVEQARLLSGNPVLGRSAERAVEQWRYAPLLLENRPIGVVTTVTVAFRLR
jgi:TonB family protein